VLAAAMMEALAVTVLAGDVVELVRVTGETGVMSAIARDPVEPDVPWCSPCWAGGRGVAAPSAGLLGVRYPSLTIR
jgi:hypothetical protein